MERHSTFGLSKQSLTVAGWEETEPAITIQGPAQGRAHAKVVLEPAWCTEEGDRAWVGRSLGGGLSGRAGSRGASLEESVWSGSDGHVTGPCIVF